MTNILVTGHNGLVGSAICKEIHCLTYPERIENLNNFIAFLRYYDITTVIHTAAKVGGVKSNMDNKIDYYLKNSNINNIVFEGCMKAKVNTLMNFSSTCVFPDNAKYPLTESQIYSGEPHSTNDAYAYAKRMMQKLCEYARAQGRNYFTVIPTNIFGENDNYNIESGHVLPALMHKTFLAKQNNSTLTVGGSGKPLREFIYAKDLARITQCLLKKEFQENSIIVSTSEEKSISECANIIAEILEFNGQIVFDHSFPDGQYRKPTSTKLFKKILPDFQFTDFKKSLTDSTKWFIENYNQCRK